MWPFAVGKGEIALATLVRGTRSISTIYEVPRIGHQHTMASRGKFPLRNTTYTTDCVSEVQRLIVSMAVVGIATTRLLTKCCVSSRKGGSTCTPPWLHLSCQGGIVCQLTCIKDTLLQLAWPM